MAELGNSQPETALLVEADLHWVARPTLESHDSKFLERAPGAATSCSGYSHPLHCHLNPREMADVLPYPESLLASSRVLPGSISTKFRIGGSGLFKCCP